LYVFHSWTNKIIYNDEEKYDLGVRDPEMIQHLGIFGRSGSGKTNTVFNVILQLIKNKKPFLIFDWKRNYRDLLAIQEVVDSEIDILTFTAGRNICNFWFNPLIPPKGKAPKNSKTHRHHHVNTSGNVRALHWQNNARLGGMLSGRAG